MLLPLLAGGCPGVSDSEALDDSSFVELVESSFPDLEQGGTVSGDVGQADPESPNVDGGVPDPAQSDEPAEVDGGSGDADDGVIGPESIQEEGQPGSGVVEFLPGRLLVKFRGLPDQAARRVTNEEGAEEEGEIPGIGVKIIKLPEQASEAAFLHAFRRRTDVEFAEVDQLHAPDATPNDPYFSSSWHLSKIGTPGAWDVNRGNSAVIVAILDSGVDSSHPDLASKIVPGWNFYDNNSNTSDVHGHGTAVAGTVAAATNNAVGVAAVAWDCRLMPMRITDLQGYGSTSAMANALVWAADHGARVANLSFRASTISTVKSAAQYFQNKGGVVTISAGNQSTFDASADNPYVLTVSATDSTDALASFTNTGNLIDLAAPGVSIRTTNRGGSYGSWSGTSFSAPVVAGVAALVISTNPNLSADGIQTILKQSADDRGPAGWDTGYGWGRVNALQAVTLAASGAAPADTTAPSVAFVSPSDGQTVSGSVIVRPDASDNVGVASVSLYLDGTLMGTDDSSPFEFAWDTKGTADGVHLLQAVAQDAAGNWTGAQVSVTVSNVVDATEPVDVTPPVVAIVSPTGGIVGKSLTVSVSASDNVGVVEVRLLVDGALTSVDTKAPWSFNLNTQKWKSGTHTLQCKAYDRAGNVGESAVVTVTRK